jgi:hypothetical protein
MIIYFVFLDLAAMHRRCDGYNAVLSQYSTVSVAVIEPIKSQMVRSYIQSVSLVISPSTATL